MVRILVAAGGKVDRQTTKRARVSLNGQPFVFSTPYPVPVKRVRAVCRTARISAAQFDELFRATTPDP